MKPHETKDEGMQRADTQIPLRSSSPASSEAQPDHCRKRCPKGGKPETQSVAPIEHREGHLQCMQYPKRNLGEGAVHGGKKNGEEERVVPFGRREKGGQKKETKLSSTRSISRCGGRLVKEQYQVRGREEGAQEQGPPRPAKSRDLTRETHVPSSNLDRADHFGPFHGSNRRRRSGG